MKRSFLACLLFLPWLAAGAAEFPTVGNSKVALHDPRRPAGADGCAYYFLNPGDRFNLRTRSLQS
jgi:hypothetical protein